MLSGNADSSKRQGWRREAPVGQMIRGEQAGEQRSLGTRVDQFCNFSADARQLHSVSLSSIVRRDRAWFVNPNS